MRTLTDRIRTLSEEELKELHKVYASTKLKDRSYIGCLLQAKPRPGGFVEAMQTEIKRLDEKNQRAAKFRPPHWPPVISLLERERRKKLRRELERAQKQPQATTSSRPPPREKKAKSHSDARPSTSKWPPVLKGLSTPALPPSASLAILPPTPAVAQLAMERVPRAHSGGERKGWRKTERAWRRLARSADAGTHHATRASFVVNQRDWNLATATTRAKVFVLKLLDGAPLTGYRSRKGLQV
ncbi:uncharacterized protein LOC111194460 [Astyanax mexicanus]|uniref:uncharacterized protein LOC111194460 n=1 Tax=Astyanax mexicanus TaxID=7994 RepID=UPI000BBDF5C8|nr:uncharacterized protein LOC111194460 [Astyanax mexicanus]